MSLAALIRGRRQAERDSVEIATATPATPATLDAARVRTVATVATVAVANPPKREVRPGPDPKAEDRRHRVLAMLTGDPALRLAVVCDGEGDPVPVTVGIRDIGTCEVHIPAARFDPFTLLDLVGRHGQSVH